ncbi:AAA family ATPase [Exiguobacterium sp. s133]|uniref:AAA family ATPase n=1 Tax=Exiguobacterium sp. s133 TaxID=2751213 RepID=UPI001BEB840F|nr:AAA family ATPase [Exiguobacterium sp. s133]
MKFVLLLGPQAVGKMTIGQELERLTGMKLFHNHQTIDLLLPYFDFSKPAHHRLKDLIRREMFKEMAVSDLEGVLFTFLCLFGVEGGGIEFIEETVALFEEAGSDVYIVELEASVATRLMRNKTENRLAHKFTKRDLAASENDLLETADGYRTSSLPGELPYPNYFRLDTEGRSAAESAEAICARFGWSYNPVGQK